MFSHRFGPSFVVVFSICGPLWYGAVLDPRRSDVVLAVVPVGPAFEE